MMLKYVHIGSHDARRSRAGARAVLAGTVPAIGQQVVFPLHGHHQQRKPDTVQLLTRHWVVTDSAGHIEEVRGAGVVGKQPTLAPGESFEYTSGWPLPTAFGILEGTYQMVTGLGEHFDARIAPVALSEPYTVH